MDADAFLSLERCERELAQADAEPAKARRQMPGKFDQYEFSACQPVTVAPPKGTTQPSI
jgi:hypothetical protein